MVHAKVDTEAEQELAAAAQIRSIPTLMAFKKGNWSSTRPGRCPPAALEDLVQQIKELRRRRRDRRSRDAEQA